MKKLQFEFVLTGPEYGLLLRIAEEGSAEYRDIEFETVEEYIHPKNWNGSHPPTEIQIQNFKRRNTDGTYHLIENLLVFNLIQHADDAWHTTYKLSEFGKLVLIFNNIDYK